jgi:hypothetical protein
MSEPNDHLGDCDFSYNHYCEIIELAKKKGYRIMPLADLLSSGDDRIMLLRHDVEWSVERAARMAEIEHSLSVRATYFIRVHSETYNPFSFKTYPSLKRIYQLGHEIGLHFENLDFSVVTGEDPSSILKRELGILQTILGIKIRGVAAHRDFSGIDNSDFSSGIVLSEYGLDYEAYQLSKEFLFVSDSLRTWRRTNGRCICEVLRSNPSHEICLLTHPDLWYQESYYLG